MNRILALGYAIGMFTTPVLAQDQSELSPKDIRSIAKEAYIFAYPLVMNYRTMHAQAIADNGFGEWLHLSASSPTDTDIVTPNNDTPYSYAWVDVRAEPWVLTLPEISANRFYTSQWDDLWGYVLDNAGSVYDGNGGVSVLLAGPDWSGALPDGIDRVIRGESEFLGTLTRTQPLGTDSENTLRNIQDSYVLQPLSTHLGTPAPQPLGAIDWPLWRDGAETRLDYWDYVSDLIPLTAQHPDDATAYAALARIGIFPGGSFDSTRLEPDTKAALLAGISDARELLADEAGKLTDGTKLFGSRATVGDSYLDRALGVYVGIFGNTKDISVYLNRDVDQAGQPLDGSAFSYEMTFAPGSLPPVKFFWSMTMYRLPQRLLVKNPIERYSIGSATPGLTMAEDGSLTLYISTKSPGPDREANWLPAPHGPFWMVLRNYGPGESILNQTYELPTVRAVQ